MSLFQKSVVQKYLNDLDSDLINNKYAQFQSFFADPVRQKNIRNSKEEQFQEGFLRELFVKVFGYTLNPEPDYNLTTELKNVANSKKADGAILNGKDAIGVIELKGTDTTDLDKIETQAFGYKNHHPKCVYVITSNFEKIRFYIQNAVDHIDFDLFNLSQEDFSLMWLCLAKDNLLNGIPQKIKDSSLLQEENITKKLYADYSKFREEIYNNLVENNPDKDKLLLFKKTQKLLDRFLFIFFAEDRLLLPPNSISEIVKQWTVLKDELDEYVPLYNRFKKYFGYMNTGYKGKKYDIYAYNGGLFAPDEILDSISIDDVILHKHTLKLSQYDFETDVDVNILGHIFEHSLGEIENVQAEIKGEKIDTQKTRRKKDGIFYTPKYITKYIVENTVGKLCEEKRSELDIVDEEYAKGRRNRKKSTIKTLDEKLTTYRDWLLSLTILDPACGSGAFLNQALDFLITEHRKIDDLRAQLLGGSIVFSDITTDILEKNIYGVDLNEESVEIAKLSLWLRTAQKGRKLNKLNNNIKCGNSLIDDPEVAGEKAFNWQNEFPQVFDNGGFDVVIGNPPYVRSRGLMKDKEKNHFTSIYKTASYQLDLYKLFIEKSLNLINKKGLLSFITPSVFLSNDYDKPLRKFILDNYSLSFVATSVEEIFADASVKTVVFTIKRKDTKKTIDFFKIEKGEFHYLKSIEKQVFVKQNYTINENMNLQSINIVSKLNDCKLLDNYFEVKNGIKVRKELLFTHKIDDNYKPFLLGKNININSITFDNIYIHYLPENEKLYTNQAFRSKEIFEQNKLIIRQILGKRIITTFDAECYYTDQTTYIVIQKDSLLELKYLLSIINSKLMYYYFKNTLSDNKVTFPKVKRSHILEFPIKAISKEAQLPFITLADRMLSLNNELQGKNKRFINRTRVNFDLQKISTKLEKFYNFDFKTFVAELKKQKVKLSLVLQDEWEEYFNTYKSEINQIQSEIEKTDKEIDQMVYELYGLTDNEIEIVEEVNK